MGGLFSTHLSHFCLRGFLVLPSTFLSTALLDIQVSNGPLYSRLLRHFHRGDSLVIPCACSLWGGTLLQNSHILFLAGTVAVHQSCRTSLWIVSETLCAPPQHPDHTEITHRMAWGSHSPCRGTERKKTLKSSLSFPGNGQKSQWVYITGRRIKLMGITAQGKKYRETIIFSPLRHSTIHSSRWTLACACSFAEHCSHTISCRHSSIHKFLFIPLRRKLVQKQVEQGSGKACGQGHAQDFSTILGLSVDPCLQCLGWLPQTSRSQIRDRVVTSGF